MKAQYSMKNMADWEQKRVEEYIQGKIPGLKKLITHFQSDEVSFFVRAERFDKNNAYQVELILEIPGKVFVGKEDSHSIEKAVDLAKDRLISQLKKHEDVLKNKGKFFSSLRRTIKELSSDRSQGAIKSVEVDEFQMAESSVSSEPDSKPTSTF